MNINHNESTMKSPDILQASAIAHPNIAFIKYWGNKDQALRLPYNNSLSMNLSALETRTSVHFDPYFKKDTLILAGAEVFGRALARVSDFLDLVRDMAGKQLYAEVKSENSFPTGAGIASSASAFAALALAASSAIGLELSEAELSRLARHGSGSACRSVPGGFVEWQAGTKDADSYAFSIAPVDHWDLVDLVCVVESAHKTTSSTSGHALADTSPLQKLRLRHVEERVDQCRKAILERDFESFAAVVEEDSNLMHAVMRTSQPPLLYWLPQTEVILCNVVEWRRQGVPVCSTVDAGPNVHVLTLSSDVDWVEEHLADLPGVQKILKASPGPGAALL